jgi:hypothetical protein
MAAFKSRPVNFREVRKTFAKILKANFKLTDTSQATTPIKKKGLKIEASDVVFSGCAFMGYLLLFSAGAG